MKIVKITDGWVDYPTNKPKESGYYVVEVDTAAGKMGSYGYFYIGDKEPNGKWVDRATWTDIPNVIRYVDKELPTPISENMLIKAS